MSQADLAERLGYQDGAALVQATAEALWHHEERGPWPGYTDETDPYFEQAGYVLAGIDRAVQPVERRHDHGRYRDGPCYGCECGAGHFADPTITCDLPPDHEGDHRTTWRS